MNKKSIANLLLFLAPLFWTVNYLVARWAPGHITPHLLALGRWALALLLMLIVLGPSIRRDWNNIRTAMQIEKWQLIILGGFGMWICGAFVYVGGYTTQAINIALIYASCPVLIAIVSAQFMHEKLSRLQIVGITLSLSGVLLVIGKGSLATFTALQFNLGDWWIIAAASSWVAYTLLLKHWPSQLSPAIRLVAITAGGIIVLIPFSLIEIVALSYTAPISSFITLRGVGLIVLAAVFPGFLAYQAHAYLLRELGAAKTSVILYLGPVYAALAAWLLLDEALYWYHWVGAAMVLPGVFLSSRTSANQLHVNAAQPHAKH